MSMKKFEFSLSKMLDYKDQILQEEKNTLMQLRAEKNAVDKKIEQLAESLRKFNDKYREEVNCGIKSEEINGFKFHLENIRYQISELYKEQKNVSNKIEKQTGTVISISQDVSGLEKLKEKQSEEYNKLAMKAEELRLSEFILSQRAL